MIISCLRAVLTCLRLSTVKKCDIILVNFTHKLEGKREICVLLPHIKQPGDLKSLSVEELASLAEEIRSFFD